MARYKFEENIFKLSETKEVAKLHDEWEFINNDERDDGHCICNRKITHVNYFYNIKTNKYIMVGDSCKDKLCLKIIKKGGVKRYIDKLMNNKGEYLEILDMIQYSNDTMLKIYQYFEDIAITNDIIMLNRIINVLKDILRKITNNRDNIENLINTLIVKVSELNKKEEEERNRLLEIRKNKEERKRLSEIRNEEERVRKEKDEKYILEYNKKFEENGNIYEIQEVQIEIENNKECKCGVKIIHVCKCDNPEFTLCRFLKFHMCIKCNNWKCRC